LKRQCWRGFRAWPRERWVCSQPSFRPFSPLCSRFFSNGLASVREASPWFYAGFGSMGCGWSLHGWGDRGPSDQRKRPSGGSWRRMRDGTDSTPNSGWPWPLKEPLQKSGWDVHDQTALACFQSLARLLSADGSLLQRFLNSTFERPSSGGITAVECRALPKRLQPATEYGAPARQ